VDTWITDTPTSERFPLFTRGNADEVGPEPFSPLGWSLTWAQGICPGVADGWCSLGGFTSDEFTWPVPETFGNWGGYFFNQVSIGRVFGVRSPGGSPDMIDESFFGKNPTVPPYVPDPRDESPDRSAAIGEVFAGVLGADRQPQYLTDFIAQVREWVDTRPDLHAMSDAELIAFGREANYRQRPTWDVYTVVTVAAAAGSGIVGGLSAAFGKPELAVEAFSAIGDVESAGTARRLWRLSRLVRDSALVAREFDAGLADVLDRLRTSSDSAAAQFMQEFDAMLATDGHRGPNEWEIMSDSWVMDPLLPLGMIDKLRRQVDGQSPDNRTAAIAARRDDAIAELQALVADDSANSGMLAAGLQSGTVYYQAREAAKDAAVRVMLEARLPFAELGRRWADAGILRDPKHVFMLLDSELDPSVATTDGWAQRLAERADTLADLSTRIPPYIVAHGEPIPPISSWRRRSDRSSELVAPGDELTGVGVAPGQASGRARVVFDLSEISAVEPGDILVCSTTDPSWVPLFLIASGVVCDVGAAGSHAAIVSRELGVPCVVSVRDARLRIPDGALLEIDGTKGVVRVVET
jgi:pyruvate,water dikinase